MLRGLIGDVSGRVEKGEVVLSLPGQSATALRGF